MGNQNVGNRFPFFLWNETTKFKQPIAILVSSSSIRNALYKKYFIFIAYHLDHFRLNAHEQVVHPEDEKSHFFQ